MSFFSSLGTAWRLGTELPGAVIAAKATWASGKGPINCLRAFAVATEGQLDDAVLAELETGCRWLLQAADQGVDYALVVKDFIPTVRKAVVQVLRVTEHVERLAVDAGFYAGVVKGTIRLWLQESTDG